MKYFRFKKTNDEIQDKSTMRKHHYLPQFYLKGFANKDGKFLIYSVLNDRFKGGGK